MAVSRSVEYIVPDTTVRRRGPVPLNDREASTPAGRALHQLEGVAFGGSQQAVYYRGDRDRRITHDMRADLHVAAIASTAQRVLSQPSMSRLEIEAAMHLILADAGGYFREDEHEDAAAANGDERVSRMHDGFKRIAGWAERSCVAIRKMAREAGR